MDRAGEFRTQLEAALEADGTRQNVRDLVASFVTAAEAEGMQDERIATAIEDAGDLLCQFNDFETARWIYGIAEQQFARFASYATSGGEGAARMLEVERVQRKRQTPEGVDPRHVLLAVLCNGQEFGLAEIEDLRTVLAQLKEEASIPDDLLRSGLKLLATATSSPLSDLLLQYFASAGPRHEGFASAVFREFQQENYSALCRNFPARGRCDEPARSWEEWEQQWEPCQQDWPIAELATKLDAGSRMLHLLSQVKGGLAPSNQTVPYFLLGRLSRQEQIDVSYLGALATLIQNSSSEHRRLLRERAAVLYLRAWNRLPHSELARIHQLSDGWDRMREAPFDNTLAG